MYPNRRRRVKTDRRDARMLAEAARVGSYRPALGLNTWLGGPLHSGTKLPLSGVPATLCSGDHGEAEATQAPGWAVIERCDTPIPTPYSVDGRGLTSCRSTGV